MPPPPVNHARKYLVCLAPTGCAAQRVLSCRFLRRDSDQASGHCPECLIVAAAGQVCSQGSESNIRWCSVRVSFSVMLSEVIGAASDFCSDIASGIGPCSPLESGITMVVGSCHLQFQSSGCHRHLVHGGLASGFWPRGALPEMASLGQAGRWLPVAGEAWSRAGQQVASRAWSSLYCGGWQEASGSRGWGWRAAPGTLHPLRACGVSMLGCKEFPRVAHSFYCGPLQQWRLAYPVGPDLLPVSFFHGFPLPSP